MTNPVFGDKQYKGGRPSKLADPEFAKLVAGLFADGLSRQAMLEVLQDGGFDVKDPDTISRWRKDPRVKPLVAKIIEDRAIQISRKIDSVIEARLAHAEELDTETLLKIRKEYGGATVGRREIEEDSVTQGAISAIESDPEFADKLAKVLSGEPLGLPEEMADAAADG